MLAEPRDAPFILGRRPSGGLGRPPSTPHRPLLGNRPTLRIIDDRLAKVRRVIGPEIGSDLFGETRGTSEDAAPLIEDPWKVLTCDDMGQGCLVDFEGTPPEPNRETLYYIRALQEPTDAVNGDPLQCERDEQGRCLAAPGCPASGPAFDPADAIISGAALLDIEGDGDVDLLLPVNGVISGSPAQEFRTRLMVNQTL